ncbi:MAG: hypothetical protein ABEJ72_02780, partial [Candidatus Aenigmatarchaeota archaeon]
MENDSTEVVTINGTVQSLEGVMTAWMYGTHVLTNNQTGERYALKSDSVNLTEYDGEKVKVSGRLVHEGIDTGPPLVRVENVIIPDGEKEGQGDDTRTTVVLAGIAIFIIVVGAIAYRT